MSALEKELETYEKELPKLLKDAGKFALVHGDQLVGVFSAYEDALKSGYEQFGLEPFLVRQIKAVQQVQYITRLLDAGCPT